MLLHFAPNSRAVRTAWLLFEIGLEFDLQRYKLGDRSMRTPEFRSISPNGRVPVLDDDGTLITESAAIAQYLVVRYGKGKFAPDASSPEFPVYLQWLHYGEGMIMGPMNNYVVETMLLPPERRSDEHARRAFKLMARALEAVEDHMEGCEYLAGDFTAADTITGHACMMCGRFGVDLTSMPNVEAYVQRLTSRRAFIKAQEL